MLVVKAEAVKTTAGPIGPFSHYSAISPASTSGTLSRQPSQTDLTTIQPPRPTSAAAHPPLGPPPVKRANFKTHHSRSSSLGFAGYDYNPSAPPPWQSYAPPTKDSTPKSTQQEFSSGSPYGGYNQETTYDSNPPYVSSYEAPSAYQEPETPNYDQPEEFSTQESNDWQGSSWQPESNYQSNLQAPTFSSSENFVEDESGFMSPMAAFTPSPSPAPTATFTPQNPQSHKRTSTRDELDDLGIGNSKSRKPAFDSIDEQGTEGEESGPSAVASSSAAQSERPGQSFQSFLRMQLIHSLAMKQSRSWLGGWFKREAGSPPAVGPGPVKANLGEQTSFVFDPDLKRWVNKKVSLLLVLPQDYTDTFIDWRRYCCTTFDCSTTSSSNCFANSSDAISTTSIRFCYSTAIAFRS